MDDREDEGRVVVRGTPEGFAQEIFAGGHILRADEPTSMGGTDTGPTPYDLLLAGLSACTSMTVRMYAQRKNWALRSTTVTLTHSKIHAADVISTSDAAHFIIWKKDGWLASHLPEDVAKHFPKDQVDKDHAYAPWRLSLSPIGYNTKLVKKEEAPKSFKDLLDPKWAGKMVKAHPSYSGTVMNATFQIARDLGVSEPTIRKRIDRLFRDEIIKVVAVLNPPQAAILAVGATEERVVARDGELEIAPLVTLTGTFDHRAVDGADAAEFLATVKAFLEEPGLAL